MSAEVHAVNLRDEVQCTQVSSDGKRCANRRWLEIHHLKPVSEGGKNEAGNLTTLCSAHHRVEHEHARLPSPRTRDIQVS
ncbi:MAG: HNH endonuclease [Bdellovibrionota bacterium]